MSFDICLISTNGWGEKNSLFIAECTDINECLDVLYKQGHKVRGVKLLDANNDYSSVFVNKKTDELDIAFSGKVGFKHDPFDLASNNSIKITTGPNTQFYLIIDNEKDENQLTYYGEFFAQHQKWSPKAELAESSSLWNSFLKTLQLILNSIYPHFSAKNEIKKVSILDNPFVENPTSTRQSTRPTGIKSFLKWLWRSKPKSKQDYEMTTILSKENTQTTTITDQLQNQPQAIIPQNNQSEPSLTPASTTHTQNSYPVDENEEETNKGEKFQEQEDNINLSYESDGLSDIESDAEEKNNNSKSKNSNEEDEQELIKSIEQLKKFYTPVFSKNSTLTQPAPLTEEPKKEFEHKLVQIEITL